MSHKYIERLAREYLSGKRKIARTEIQKEAKKYANRIKQYKKISKKSKVSKEVREALHYVTASEYENRKRTLKDYARNVNEFTKRYGEPTEHEMFLLKYFSAKKVAYKVGKGVHVSPKPIPQPGVGGGGHEPTYDKKFSEPQLGKVSWNQLPLGFKIKQREWPHTSGSYMYNNADQFWNGSQIVDLDILANVGADGFDHSNTDFFISVVARIRPDIFFQVGLNGSVWWTTKAEWNSRKELAPDYLQTRMYR